MKAGLFCIRVLFFLFLLGFQLKAQERGRARAAKVSALLKYAESLRINSAGSKDVYPRLDLTARLGLQLLEKTDYTNRSRFLFYQGISNYYLLRFDSAQLYFYKSLASATQGKSAVQITKACVALIPVNFQLQQPAKVEQCKIILQSIRDTTKNRLLLQDIYYSLGSYYQQKSYYSSAQDYFIKSIELREKELDTTQSAKKKFDYAIQCDMLSKLYLNTEMPERSLAMLRRAYRFAAISPGINYRLLSSFVEAFTTSGNIDSALVYNRKISAGLKNSLAFPSEQFSSDLNIAIYYLKMHQYDQARSFIALSRMIADKVNSPLLSFQLQMVQGRLLEETGNFAQSLNVLKQAIPVARQYSRELTSNILKLMALDEKGLRHEAGSLVYFQEYVDLTDSLTKSKVSRTFADLQEHYETNQKEKTIKNLGNENKLRRLELIETQHQRLLLVIGLGALAVIAFLLYLLYHNKELLGRDLEDRNNQLSELNLRLAEANQTKTKLFGIIGHDLRSPISRIVQLLKLEKESPGLFTPEESQAHHSLLKKASENLLETMEDLVVWGNTQMQNFDPKFSRVNIRDVLNKEIVLLKEHYADQELAFIINVPLDLTQWSDEYFLIVIFRNLLHNAVKYRDVFKPIEISASKQALSIINQQNSLLVDAPRQFSSGMGLQIVRDLSAKLNIRFKTVVTPVLRFEASLFWLEEERAS